MATLKELISQRDALERQIEQARESERSSAVEKVRALMGEYGLTVADLAPRGAKKASAPGRSKVAAKYRNPATGDTWSGRGLKPKWLTAAIAGGAALESFAV